MVLGDKPAILRHAQVILAGFRELAESQAASVKVKHQKLIFPPKLEGYAGGIKVDL